MSKDIEHNKIDFNQQTQIDSSATDPLQIIGTDVGGKYRVTKHLGAGGFGEVYNGFNVNLPEQRLVLKFFKEVQAREQFAKEAKILCLVDHPNISRVIDFLGDEGALVVAFIDGKDGSQILKESGKLSEKLYLEVARTMTDALAHAHERQIAHRDIKPANIMVDSNGRVYLIDFGIAKEIGSNATRTGYQALTPMFAAPERQQGEAEYNPFLSDIYEMGVTLFMFASNSLPYRSPINPDTSDWGGNTVSKLSPELVEILKRATNPNPARRYNNMREMANDVATLKCAYAPRKKRKTPIILGVLFTLVVAAAVAEYKGYFDRWLGPSPERFGISELEALIKADPQEIAEPASRSSVVSDQTVTDTGMAASENGPAVELKVDPSSATPEQTESQSVSKESESESVIEKEVTSPPPPPAKPRVSISTRPRSLINLFFDGEEQMPGFSFVTTMGSHRIEISDPDFPVLSRTVNVTKTTSTYTLDLIKEFANADSVAIEFELSPHLDQHALEISLNGRKQVFESFAISSVVRLEGEWKFEATLSPLTNRKSGSISIDSCVTRPNGGGKSVVMKGNRGHISISANGSDRTGKLPLIIYWSRK